jgi:hypothetical protein
MDKYYILRIGIPFIFIIWLLIPISNEKICKNISGEMSADRSKILDSITKLYKYKGNDGRYCCYGALVGAKNGLFRLLWLFA